MAEDAISGFRRPPRVVATVTVKRMLPRLGDSYGHWWVEVDGAESYGWWPGERPLKMWRAFRGVEGRLNGLGTAFTGGSTTRDPRHLGAADYAFHPTLVVRKSNRRLRRDIREFAQSYSGEWRWSPRPSSNCRSFQLDLLRGVGLDDGDENVRSRGLGCPFLRPFRAINAGMVWLATGRRPHFALIPPPLRPGHGLSRRT